ncbi:MAG: glycosyltransferase family 2 protein [Deferribacteres bacterium]|nr:glycosyltransferase family 2 protein [Deferribacteres bacterium]
MDTKTTIATMSNIGSISTATPFISIITPVFNRADCIGRCIESVANQGFADIEQVVINDGSTDKTKEIVESYAKKYPWVRLIQLDQNRGVNHARNSGIKSATGRFLIFLDSDDYLLENGISSVIESLKEQQDYEHYLFAPDDRADFFSQHPILKKPIHEFYFLNWLKGEVDGDFVHVVSRKSFDSRLFFEDFRAFEYLNWLRIYKANLKQLYIHKVIVSRERTRFDSLTKEYCLDNKLSIEDQYRYIQRLVELFYEDYRAAAKNTILELMHKAVLLGIAAGSYTQNIHFLELLKKEGQNILVLRILNRLRVGPLLFLLLWIKTKIGKLKLKLQ